MSRRAQNLIDAVRSVATVFLRMMLPTLSGD
jgi:hypothetical protein